MRGGEVAPGPSAEHGVRPAGGAPHPSLPLQDGPAYGEHGSLCLLHCLQEVSGLLLMDYKRRGQRFLLSSFMLHSPSPDSVTAASSLPLS